MVQGSAPAHAPGLQVPAYRAGGQPGTVLLTENMLRDALANGELVVQQADGKRFRVRMVRGQDEPNGRWSVIGKVVTRLGEQSMVLTFHGRDVFGILPQPDGTLLAISTTRGITTIKPAGGMHPPHTREPVADYVLPPPRSFIPRRMAKTGRSPPSIARGAGAPAAGAEVEIVLLGLYTDDLVGMRGSVSAVETEISNLVAISTQAHADSDSPVRFRLAALAPIPESVGATNVDLLEDVAFNLVEGVDVHALRDAAQADLVFIIRPFLDGNNTCGNGYLAGAELDPSQATEVLGYSITNLDPCGPYVLPHELGHNLGSMHDRDSSRTFATMDYGAFTYSFGFRKDEVPTFTTIMGYEVYAGDRIPYFSNPDLMACGMPCGISDIADNVRSFRQMAPVIASYRGAPAGTVSIEDAVVSEPSGGNGRIAAIKIRSAEYAPDAGIALDVQVLGGSARDGLDYRVLTSQPTIDPGRREGQFYIEIAGDDEVEGDETISLRLSGAQGLDILDPDATLLIVDDDPRPRIQGEVRFTYPAAPTEGFDIQVLGPDSGEDRFVRVEPPGFAYSIPVMEGAEVTLVPWLPSPWAAKAVRIERVTGNVNQDCHATVGAIVSGRVLLPEDGAVPEFPLTLLLDEGLDNIYRPARPIQVGALGERFELAVYPGSSLQIKATPGMPYLPYLQIDPYVAGDVVHDVVLSELPTLSIQSGSGRSEYWTGADYAIGIAGQLSAPAPPGGVTYSYRTESGTAIEGEDFVGASGRITIPEGGLSYWDAEVMVLGDDDFEGDEYFKVIIEDVDGASLATPVSKVVIRDDDARTGGPAQKQQAP